MNQNPHCEGPNRDRLIFTLNRRLPDYKVYRTNEDSEYKMDAGAAHGISQGAQFTLYVSDVGVATLIAEKPAISSTILKMKEVIGPPLSNEDGYVRYLWGGNEEDLRLCVTISGSKSPTCNVPGAPNVSGNISHSPPSPQMTGEELRSKIAELKNVRRGINLVDSHLAELIVEIKEHEVVFYLCNHELESKPDSKPNSTLAVSFLGATIRAISKFKLSNIWSFFGMSSESAFHHHDWSTNILPYTVPPNIAVVYPVIDAAAHYFYHLRRAPVEHHLNTKVIVEFFEVEETDEMDETGLRTLRTKGKNMIIDGEVNVFIEEKDKSYGMKLTSTLPAINLHYSVFFFESDLRIVSYHQPGVALNMPAPSLEAKGVLSIGFGDGDNAPRTYSLREEQDFDIGFLKIFLSTFPLDLSHIVQKYPFETDGTRRQATARKDRVAERPVSLLWDTIVIPVKQQRRGRANLHGSAT